MRPSLLILAGLLAWNVGCKTDDLKPSPSVASTTPKPKVEPLPASPNGSPVSAEFLGFTEGDIRYIQTRLFNTGDKVATGYVILVRFFDVDGALVPVRQGSASERPSTFMSYTGGSHRIDPGKDHRIVMEGVEVPLDAHKAEAIVSRVDTVSDGEPIAWFSQPRWGQWPTDETDGSK
jgi:hypothetical protein